MPLVSFSFFRNPFFTIIIFYELTTMVMFSRSLFLTWFCFPNYLSYSATFLLLPKNSFSSLRNFEFVFVFPLLSMDPFKLVINFSSFRSFLSWFSSFASIASLGYYNSLSTWWKPPLIKCSVLCWFCRCLSSNSSALLFTYPPLVCPSIICVVCQKIDLLSVIF